VEGRQVVSCDPLYRFTPAKILARTEATRDTVVENARAARRAARHEFVWREIESPEQLGEKRMVVMQRFLADFPGGLTEGRYRAHTLPHLDFRDGAFDLALCSHFFFTYSGQLTLDFHATSIEEMCRVAGEARVFPLLHGYGGRSPHLQPVIGALSKRAYRVEIRGVPYEFQRGRDEMLAVAR
jgi:hypothetical protein